MTFNPLVADSVAELLARPRNLDYSPHKPETNGWGLCVHCGRPVHLVDPPYKYMRLRLAFYRHNPLPRMRVIPDRERNFCSKCSRPGQWFEFKPGSGECTECQT